MFRLSRLWDWRWHERWSAQEGCQFILAIKLQHGICPGQIFAFVIFPIQDAIIDRAPGPFAGNAHPTVIFGNTGKVHIIASWYSRLRASALLKRLWIARVTAGKIPGQFRQGFAKLPAL